jgi:hypothetical protein
MAVPPGTTAMILATSDYNIPPGQEFYQCQRVTVTDDLYIVKFTPIAPPGVHHQVLAIDPTGSPDGVSTCQAFGPSWSPLFASGVGSPDLVLPDGVALKVSKGQQVVLNLHLFNATNAALTGTAKLQVAVAVDPTGYALAGVPFVGNVTFTVGPTLQVNGQCTMSNDTKYFAVFPHMHMTGAHMKVTVSGSVSQTLWDEDYSFNDQKFGMWAPLQLKAGDKISNTCTYGSDGLGKKFGDSSTDEMCFAISYVTPPVSGTLGQPFCIN